jgi:hypothetical protein
VRSTPHRPARGAICLALALALLACGERSRAPGSRSDEAREDVAAWATRLAEPTPGTLLEALAQPHSVAREVLGPHRLVYKARFSLVPEDEPAPPRVGRPAPAAQEVEDDLELVWGSNPGETPRFSLSQHNDHDRGRDVIVLDGNAYTRMRNRGWLVRQVESDISELWLDDAQLAAHDMVELAAPRLHVASESSNVDGESMVEIDLGLSDSVDASLLPRTGWRREATIDQISGGLTLLAGSGVWLSAEIVVHYRLRPAEGGILRGTASLEGKVQRIAGGAAQISPPVEARPVPQRIRYEVERKHLLEGLAAH